MGENPLWLPCRDLSLAFSQISLSRSFSLWIWEPGNVLTDFDYLVNLQVEILVEFSQVCCCVWSFTKRTKWNRMREFVIPWYVFIWSTWKLATMSPKLTGEEKTPFWTLKERYLICFPLVFSLYSVRWGKLYSLGVLGVVGRGWESRNWLLCCMCASDLLGTEEISEFRKLIPLKDACLGIHDYSTLVSFSMPLPETSKKSMLIHASF